ncbi:hypothetical protein HYT17_00590 [Candidatus Microgenomates bacterium]|nr:hypothetical protein [Candidatus Microgenomates bacterium]
MMGFLSSLTFSKNFLMAAGLLVVLTAIPLTVFLAQQQQELRQRAQEKEPAILLGKIVSSDLAYVSCYDQRFHFGDNCDGGDEQCHGVPNYTITWTQGERSAARDNNSCFGDPGRPRYTFENSSDNPLGDSDGEEVTVSVTMQGNVKLQRWSFQNTDSSANPFPGSAQSGTFSSPGPNQTITLRGLVLSGGSISNFTSSANWLVPNYYSLGGIPDFDNFIKPLLGKIADGRVERYEGSRSLSSLGSLSNQKKVIIIDNGDLVIDINFTPANASTAFIVKNKINISPSVSQVNAILLSWGGIDTAVSSTRLTVNGMLLSYGHITLGRTSSDPNSPAETVNYEPRLLLDLIDILGKGAHFWQEVAP